MDIRLLRHAVCLVLLASGFGLSEPALSAPPAKAAPAKSTTSNKPAQPSPESRYAAEEADLTKQLAAGQPNLSTLVARAKVRLKLKKPKLALEDALAAAELSPNNGEVRKVLCLSYVCNENFAEAQKYLPEGADDQSNLFSGLVEFYAGDNASAVKHLKQVVAAGEPAVLGMKAFVLLESGDLDDAIATCNDGMKFSKSESDKSNLYLMRAMAEKGKGQPFESDLNKASDVWNNSSFFKYMSDDGRGHLLELLRDCLKGYLKHLMVHDLAADLV